MTIKVNSEDQNPGRPVDLAGTDKIVRKVLAALGRSDAEVNIVFLNSQRIRVLNRLYLGIDAATDVMAFPGAKTGRLSRRNIWPRTAEKRSGKQAREFLGEIAISSDRAARNAKVHGTSFKEEIALYVIHGLLHLAGYRDKPEKDRLRMRKKENEFLQEVRGIL